MYQLAPIDVSAATIGTPIPVDLGPVRATFPWHPVSNPGTIDPDMNQVRMFVFNESGIKFRVLMPEANKTFTLPPGGWVSPVPMDWNEQGIQFVPQTIISTTLPRTLNIDIYEPGEVMPSYILGNSPIGVSGVVVSNSASNEMEQDLFTPFVLFGLVSTKDSSVANQLDVTNGVSLIRQADQGVARVVTNSSNTGQFLTTASNSTYFLDLNPDGTFSFATTHSAQQNYLTIASVATDGSGNISTVTDTRQVGTTLFTQWPSSGLLNIPVALNVTPSSANIALQGTAIANGNIGFAWFPNAAHPTAGKLAWYKSDGTYSFAVFDYGVNGHTSGNLFAVDENGAVVLVGRQAAVPPFGVAPIVAQTPIAGISVTTIGTQNILTLTPAATGLYRVGGYIAAHPSVNSALVCNVNYTGKFSATTGVFSCDGVGIGNHFPTRLDGSTVFAGGNTWDLPLVPLEIYATTATNIVCQYNDPSGVPADTVWFTIERLA